MGNYRLVLEYDGTEYSGFQRQPGLPTVQGALEKAISDVAIPRGPLYAAGRTDAGVHARGQVVSFQGSLKAPVSRLPYALNSILPKDISVKEAEEVPEDFDARRSARSREYIYNLYLGEFPSPLKNRYAFHHKGALDLDAMGEALDCVVGVHDFASFCRREKGKSTVREVYQVELLEWADLVGIRVRANAFVWMMMRMLSGSLLKVGEGKWSVEYFREVLSRSDNSLSGPCIPPRGLVLERVYY